jgi:hypothetical protein
MELSWNDRRTRQFLTNVGLITTDGPYGPNVMAAEWTHHVSYSPSLIAINVRGDEVGLVVIIAAALVLIRIVTNLEISDYPLLLQAQFSLELERRSETMNKSS